MANKRKGIKKAVKKTIKKTVKTSDNKSGNTVKSGNKSSKKVKSSKVVKQVKSKEDKINEYLIKYDQHFTSKHFDNESDVDDAKDKEKHFITSTELLKMGYDSDNDERIIRGDYFDDAYDEDNYEIINDNIDMYDSDEDVGLCNSIKKLKKKTKCI